MKRLRAVPFSILVLWAVAQLVGANLREQEQTGTSTQVEFCAPQQEADRSCLWTGECTVEGCAGQCVLNPARHRSDEILADRAFDEAYWQICPELAHLVKSLRPVNNDARRSRRLLQHGGNWGSFKKIHAQSLEQQKLGGTYSHSIRNSASNSRSLVQSAEDGAAPDAAAESNVPAEYTLVCPTEDMVDEAAVALQERGEQIDLLFRKYAADGVINMQSAALLNSPNKWLKLLEYLHNPDDIKTFMSSNCAQRTIMPDDPGRRAAEIFVERGGVTVPQAQPLNLCTDNGEKWQNFHQALSTASTTCASPFGLNPSCFPADVGMYLIDDEYCAADFSNVYSVAEENVYILQYITSINQELHTECNNIHVKDWCIEVEVDPHVVELTMESDEMHSKLPFRSQTVLAKSVYAMYQKQANTTNMATGNDDTTKQQSSTVNTTNGFLEGSTGAATAPMGSTAPTQDSTGDGQVSDQVPNAKLQEQEAADAQEDFNILFLIGPVLAIIFILVACVAAAVFLKKRKMRQEDQKQGTGGKKPRVLWGKRYAAQTRDMTSALSLHRPPSMCSEEWNRISKVQASSKMPGTPGGHTVNSSVTQNPKPSYYAASSVPGVSFDGSQTGSILPLPPVFGPAEVNGDTCLALDFLYQNKLRFGKQYELQESSQRWIGSHGIVQLATMISTGETVAIKIYTNQQCFFNERRIYNTKEIAPALGASPIFSRNLDRAASTPYSYYFPPYTISEKCASLEKTMRRGPVDFLTVMQVLGQLLKSLKALHDGGFAHRNLKPSNILRRRSHNDWVLADFACATILNKGAPLPLTAPHSPYTAPEIALGLPPGRSPFGVSTRAADIWALGVIMFELLTNEHIMEPDMPCELMYQGLIGTVPLPWEAGAEGAETSRQKLGMLRNLVMPCLFRNHQDRPSAGQLLQQWWHLCDAYAMHAPQQRRITPVPKYASALAPVSTYSRRSYNTYNSYNTVSSAQGGAGGGASMLAPVEHNDPPAAAPSGGLSATPVVNAPLEDSTVVLDSDALDIAHLHTAQQSSVSVPLEDDTGEIALPAPPTAAARKHTPPDARVEAHATSKAAIRKWQEGSAVSQGPDSKAEAHAASRAAIRKWQEASAKVFQGHAGASSSSNRRVKRKVSGARALNVHESASTADGPATASGSIPSLPPVGSTGGSVTVMGGSGDLIRSSPSRTHRTRSDGTREDRGSDARTKSTGAGTPPASIEMSPVQGEASVPLQSEGDSRAQSESAVSPMRLR